MACSAERPADDAAAGRVVFTPSASWSDSLVLAVSEEVGVWFTSGREAQGADGGTCVERTMQIRSGQDAILVPLLYTGSAPVLVDDTTMQADLWLNCEPGDRYLVDLRTGRPTVVDR